MAGDLLALVAADFDRQSSGLTQTGLYRRALDLEVRNPTALAGLAWSFESSGQHRRSLAYLELLFAFVPRDEDVRLRRAVNLCRVGRRAEAVQILQRLAENAQTGWIGALAHQQWARVLLDEADFQAALEVLRRGRSSYPLESALATATAYVEERLNQTAVAGDADLAAMAPWSSDTVASRFVYATFASPWVEDARLRLRQVAAQASPSLARALKETAAEADR